MLGIINESDVNQAVRAAKLRDKRLRFGAVAAYFCVELIGILNVAKKSKKVKRGAPARKKKGMKKAKPAKRAKTKKRVPKPAPAPATPSQPAPAPQQPAPAPPPLAGMTEDQ